MKVLILERKGLIVAIIAQRNFAMLLILTLMNAFTPDRSHFSALYQRVKLLSGKKYFAKLEI